VPKKKPEPFIGGISRDGKVEIKFSEPMVLPDFAKNKRFLEEGLKLSQIDVTRDVMDFEFG